VGQRYLVIYNDYQSPIWAANTGGNDGQYTLVMQNDCNLVVYPDDYYTDSNGQSQFQIANSGAVWATSATTNSYPWTPAYSPLEPDFSVSFACSNSGDWRWNNYGGTYVGAQLGIWWDGQPASNELYSFHVVGFVGTDKAYVIAVDGSNWVNYNGGNGLQVDSQVWPFIITCNSLSGDQFTGSNCIISAFGVGCVQNIDAEQTIQLGFGYCSQWTIWQNQDGVNWGDWLGVWRYASAIFQIVRLACCV